MAVETVSLDEKMSVEDQAKAMQAMHLRGGKEINRVKTFARHLPTLHTVRVVHITFEVPDPPAKTSFPTGDLTDVTVIDY